MLRLRLAELPRTYAALWQVADNLRVPASNTAPVRQIHGSRALRRKDNGGTGPSAPIVLPPQRARAMDLPHRGRVARRNAQVIGNLPERCIGAWQLRQAQAQHLGPPVDPRLHKVGTLSCHRTEPRLTLT